MTRGLVVLVVLAALGGLAALRRRQRQHVDLPQRRYADYLTPPAPDGPGWFQYGTGDR